MELPKLYEAVLARHVVSLDELKALKIGLSSRQLQNHVKILLRRGYLGLVRKGLYYVVPVGQKAHQDVSVDKLLVGAKVTPDAVLAYRSALEFHGLSRSVLTEVTFLSDKAISTFEFQTITFRRVANSANLKRNGKASLGIVVETHLSDPIRVTSRERTLVDAIHRPELAGGLENIIHAIQACPSIDTDAVCKYTLALGLPSVYGEVGWLLERFGAKAGIKPGQFENLRKRLPKFVPYLDKDQKPARYDKRWHVLVPERFVLEETGAPH